MIRTQWTVASLVTVAAWGLAAIAEAQPPPTVWHALGIPQSYKYLKDGTANRTGNRPNRERKPPLKALADPANIKSDVPAIKKAAEIKAQEDLAPQKIKALKYLAQIGCGCHGGVAEALMAALEDCTEEVRNEAALALGQALCNRCDVCTKTCCTKELAAKMYERAWEQDDDGCWIESSERVREALREALNICPPEMESPEIDRRPSIDPSPTPAPPAPIVPPTPAASETEEPQVLTRLPAPDADLEHPASSRRGWQNKQPVFQTAKAEIRGKGQPAEESSLLVTLVPPAPAPKLPVALEQREIVGVVTDSKSTRGYVRVEFPDGFRPRVGSEVKVYHTYVLGTEQVGSLIIRTYEGDLAICSPPAWSSGKIVRGDEVHGVVAVPVAP